MEPPRFARQLANRIEVNENEPVHFEARIQPASDVKMTVEWYHNGAPLAAAHRFRPMFDFGYVALDILYAYPEDSGTYTLVARNELGEVQSNLELIVNSKKTLYLDPHHPEGLERIRELEQDRTKPLEYPADRECDNPPNFIGDLSDKELNEHEDIHLALKVTPVNDPTMVVEWFVNGQPLLTGSRVKASNDFGFLTMDIRSAIAEDSGVYTVKATNALGEASRQCRILVKPHAVVLSQTQHEESLGKIHEIENLNKYGRTEIEDKKPEGPPRFVQSLPGNIGEVEEGHPLHMECQVRPTGDNTLTITWLKDGHSIPTGHRFRTFHDFGFVSLDILDVYAADSGTYTCVAKNALGQAETSLTFTCKELLIILQYEWLLNGHPLMKAHRFVLSHDFGFIALNILYMYPEDSGTYTLIVRKAAGEAQSTVDIDCAVKGNMITESFHPNSIQRIRELEMPLQPPEERPEAPRMASQIVRAPPPQVDNVHESQTLHLEAQIPPLTITRVVEGESVRLECRLQPVNDPTLKVYWTLNGQPIPEGSRFMPARNFDYVNLDLLAVFGEDSGVYSCRAVSELDEATTSCTVKCQPTDALLLDTQHQESWNQIQDIENRRPDESIYEEPEKMLPSFVVPLPSHLGEFQEGSPVHFEGQVE
ncbi:unnamed protein product [Toxocara canis]|uniref:Titin n=1 Tax=Toxocara canis TaxID=6265 RepID=A0A183V9Y7_TOXCA|nr:unnamed protein product [Toxocara canis]